MVEPLKKDTAADLFTLHVRGVLAQALYSRGIEPSPEQMAVLGTEDLTERQIAEFAHDLGFEVFVSLVDRTEDSCYE